jgi:hypothetical protein
MINAAGGNTCTDKEARYRATVAGGGAEAKPFGLRDAMTHELLASFSSSTDETIPDILETINTPPHVRSYLSNGPNRGEMLCFWDFGVLRYFCYENETIKELELRTGRCFERDVTTKLRLGIPKKIPFIPEVTVTNGTETHQLKGYSSYSGAARMVGLAKNQRSGFRKLLQGKQKSCGVWRLVV